MNRLNMRRTWLKHRHTVGEIAAALFGAVILYFYYIGSPQ